MKRNKLTVLTLLISLSFIVYHVVFIAMNRHDDSDIRRSHNSETNDMELNIDERLRALENENDKLRSDIRGLRMSLNAVIRHGIKETPAFNSDVVEKKVVPLREAEETAANDAYAEEVEELEAIEARIGGNEYSEAVSDDVYYRLEEMLENRGLTESRIVSVACSDTACKITAAHDSTDYDVLEAFHKVATGHPPLEGAAIIVPSTPDDSARDTSTVYYVKPDSQS